MNLDEAYQLVCETPYPLNDIEPNIAALERHVEETGATKIIELGVRSGVSTVVFLMALREHFDVGGISAYGAKGTLYSVDVNWPAGPFAGLLSEIAANTGLGAWKFVHGDDLDLAIIDTLPKDADIVFVDTVHQYEHTYAELAQYEPLVVEGGRILLHDTQLEYPETAPGEEPFPVRRAAERFAGECDYKFENDPTGYGLGCIYV